MNMLFIKMAFRNINRNKFHSLINITGFSIGIATALYLFLFIHHETGFDKFLPATNRTYRLVETIQIKDRQQVSGFAWYPLAHEVKNQIPSVESFCRLSEALSSNIKVGDARFKLGEVRATDGNFTDFFGLSLTSGKKGNVLSSPDKILLSEKTAAMIFGTTDCEGRQLEMQNRLFTVSGVINQLPANTHLSFDALISNSFLENNNDYYIGWTGGVTFVSYLRLVPGASAEQVRSAVNKILDQYVNIPNKGNGIKETTELQKVAEIHLHSDPAWRDIGTNRSLSSLYLITLIGLLLLVMAVFNYISLYIAQKAGKIKDTGILSVHGANRLSLREQLFIEVLIISLIASIIALILFQLFTPYLNSFFNTNVSMRDNLFVTALFMVALSIILSVIITFFSGRNFSRPDLTKLLKGEAVGGHKMTAGRVLVAVQFFVITVLLIAGLYVNRQYKFLLNKDLGFDSKNVLVLSTDANLTPDQFFQFKQQLLRYPEISGVSVTTQSLGSGLTSNGYRLQGDEGVSMFNVIYTDASFLDLFNIKLTSGRNFHDDAKADSNSIIVNEAMVKFAGWQEPLGQTIKRNGPLKVIGTVKDFNFSPLNENISPLLIMCNPAYDGWNYSYVNILCQTNDIQQLVSRIKSAWDKRFPDAAVETGFLDQQVAANYSVLVSAGRMLTFFTLLIMLIACLGLLGLASYMAQRRTKEIGIRKTNGATTRQMMVLLIITFLKWIGFSMLLSFPAGWILIRLFQGEFAYKASVNAWLFLSAGLLALLTALLAITHQTWKAASRNPVEALRYE